MTDWRSIFGHPQPYDPQVDGIETAIETARDGGYTVIEGACGTGKTMIALTAGIDLVRDPDTDYERVLVLTSVKQQLRQFEEDLETINANLPDDWNPVSGLTLVGKADVCPYNRERAAGFDDGNVYDRCETLRDRTRDLTGEAARRPLRISPHAPAASRSASPTVEIKAGAMQPISRAPASPRPIRAICPSTAKAAPSGPKPSTARSTRSTSRTFRRKTATAMRAKPFRTTSPKRG